MTAELWLHTPHPDEVEHIGCVVRLDPERVVELFRGFGDHCKPTVSDIIDALD